jgi:Protein of unknown function (DUF2889)
VSSVTREELHRRSIEMRGFRRSDGLYEIEGNVVDRKPADFRPGGHGAPVPAGAPIHDLGVRLVFDADLVVHDVDAFMQAYPYPQCVGGGGGLAAMKGMRIGSGWSRAVRELLSGPCSCTHLRELLIPMATTAYQTLGALRQSQPPRLAADGRPVQIDSCYAYAADRDLVRLRWPEFHRTRREAPP